MPWVEVTNRYEHVDTPCTHTIADEMHNRNKTDSATSWLSEWYVPSVNRASDSESLFFFLFFFFFPFSIQPSKQSYRDRDEASIYHCRVRTKISHILCSVLRKVSLSSQIYHCRVRTKISYILCSVLRQVSLSSQCLASFRSWNGYRRTDRKTSRNTEQGVGWGEWGEEHITDEHSSQGENCYTSCRFTLQKQ